tara:strand:+ start:5142 stop:5999 length:858 start_codon:yes stop_codon:yes gene_type:complete
MNDIEFIKNIISSFTTAIITKTSVSPITRIKVLKQIESYHSTTKYNNLNKSIKYIYNNEGFLGFYKGNLINIYRAIPNYCLKFPLNDLYLKSIIKDTKHKSIKELPFNELLKAGVFTGTIQTTIMYPIDVIRTRIIQDKDMIHKKTTVVNCLTNTIKKEGFKSLYNGFIPAILTSPLYIGLQLSLYQSFKNREDVLSNSLIAGGLSGVISQSIMYPGDTIKRHLQINGFGTKKYSNLRECIYTIYKNEGVAGFYKGIKLNSIKSIPEIAIKFTIYEQMKYLLNKS